MTLHLAKTVRGLFKVILFGAILLINSNQIRAQYPEQLKRFNLAFESPADLSKYLTLSELHVFGWENVFGV